MERIWKRSELRVEEARECFEQRLTDQSRGSLDQKAKKNTNSKGYRCLVSVLPPKAMLKTVVCVSYHWRLCGCLWSLLPPEPVWKPMIYDEADCWGQESFFCSGTDDARLIIENERQGWFLQQLCPSLPKSELV